MKSITVLELEKWKEEGKDFQLIDVRENEEYEQANIDGEHIVLGTIPANIDKISKDKDVVVMCRSGKRSANAIMFLEQNGFDNLFNLEGGILAYKAEIDETLDVE